MGRWSGRVGTRAPMVAVVLVALAALAVPGVVGAVPGPGDADLSGRVVDDANGAGVDGAVVCLWDDDGAICTTTANNGRYAFDDVAGDVAYELRVVPPVGTSYLPVGGAPGTYVPVPAVPVTPAAGGTTTRDLALSKGGRFAVTVRLPDDATRAPGQPVWVCRTDDPGGPGSCPTIVPAPATNALGQSLTPVLLPGDYEITAGSASGPVGYPATVAEYVGEDSTQPVSIRLIGGGSLAGDVVDTDGLAVVGAQVSVAVPSIGTQQRTTDDDGGYSFPSLPPGTYVVTVTPPSGSDLGSSTNPAVGIVEFGEAEVDFVLGPASTIVASHRVEGVAGPFVGSGVVYCAVPGVPVMVGGLPSCAPGGGPFGLGTSPFPGYFTATGLGAGSYNLRAAYRGPTGDVVAASEVETLTIGGDEIATCAFVADPGLDGDASCTTSEPASLTGTITDDVGLPIPPSGIDGPGILVCDGTFASTFRDTCPGGSFVLHDSADGSGDVEIGQLPPGTYDVRAFDFRYPDYTWASPATVTVAPGDAISCTAKVPGPTVCTVNGGSADDGDGVDEPPPGHPADYDGNGDGIPDAAQANVTSLIPAVGPGPVTIAVTAPPGATLANVGTGPVPATPAPPGGATFPVGVLGFDVVLPEGAATADVDVHLPAGTDPSGYLKLVGDAWVALADSGPGTHATVDGDVVTLHLVDGDGFDTDATPGVIGDPGAPVVGYGFSGFLPPLGKEKAAKAGSTIPVKWRITAPDGTPVADPTSFVALTEAPCGGGAGTPIGAPLRYQGDGTWQVSWKTAKGVTGCRTLALWLDDGLAGRTIDVRLR